MKIISLPHRASRIVYSDFKLSFEGLLMKGSSFSTHESNIQSLAIEIYKFLNALSPSFLNNVFHKNMSNSYDLRYHKELYAGNPKTVRYGTETVSYIAPKIWSKISETIKNCTMLVLLTLFSFYYFGFVDLLVLYILYIYYKS